jgi:hypothetical protein
VSLIYSANLGILDRFKNDCAFSLRKRVFDLFMNECSPRSDSRVADFGVSGHRSHRAHYFFEGLYPYPKSLTAIGRASEQAGWLPEQFPGLTYLEADLRAIPLPDQYFEYGICNAVVEHAGPRDQQAALVREVCRVCQCVMLRRRTSTSHSNCTLFSRCCTGCPIASIAPYSAGSDLDISRTSSPSTSWTRMPYWRYFPILVAIGCSVLDSACSQPTLCVFLLRDRTGNKISRDLALRAQPEFHSDYIGTRVSCHRPSK